VGRARRHPSAEGVKLIRSERVFIIVVICAEGGGVGGEILPTTGRV